MHCRVGFGANCRKYNITHIIHNSETDNDDLSVSLILYLLLALKTAVAKQGVSTNTN